MDPITYRHAEPSPCPRCDRWLDRTSHGRGAAVLPKPGDLTLCIGCCALLVFDDNMRLAEPSAEILADIDAETMAEVEQIKTAIRITRGH